MLNRNPIVIAPSVLSANFLNLKPELETIKAAGAEWIHFDVMDGDFVPNLTFGPKILATIHQASDLYLDCHLMVKFHNRSITSYLTPFVEAGANQITLHYEALSEAEINTFIYFCQTYKIAAALAIKPNTDWTVLKPYLKWLNTVLIMSVEPGFGGQKFMPIVIPKIKALRAYLTKKSLPILIEVDGGINQETGQAVIEAGADVLVAGSYLFGHEDIAARIASLKGNHGQ